MQAAAGPADAAAPDVDGLLHFVAVRPEGASQRLEEMHSFVVVERAIAVQYVARQHGAGGFAAAGEQPFAQRHHAGRIQRCRVRPAAAAQQVAATFGNRRQQIGQEIVTHGRGTLAAGTGDIIHGNKAYCLII